MSTNNDRLVVATPQSRLELSQRFMSELLASVESLTAIAAQYEGGRGVRALADLIYLQQSITEEGFIDAYPDGSAILDVIKALPSAPDWLCRFIKVDDPDDGNFRMVGLTDSTKTVRVESVVEGGDSPYDLFVHFSFEDPDMGGDYGVLMYQDAAGTTVGSEVELGDWRYSSGIDQSFDDAAHVPESVLAWAETLKPLAASVIEGAAQRQRKSVPRHAADSLN